MRSAPCRPYPISTTSRIMSKRISGHTIPTAHGTTGASALHPWTTATPRCISAPRTATATTITTPRHGCGPTATSLSGVTARDASFRSISGGWAKRMSILPVSISGRRQRPPASMRQTEPCKSATTSAWFRSGDIIASRWTVPISGCNDFTSNGVAIRIRG